jgi:hypothetical protein
VWAQPCILGGQCVQLQEDTHCLLSWSMLLMAQQHAGKCNAGRVVQLSQHDMLTRKLWLHFAARSASSPASHQLVTS